MSQPNQPTGQGDSWYQEDSGQKAKKFPLGGPANDGPQNSSGAVQPQPEQHSNPFNPFAGPGQQAPAPQQGSAPQQASAPQQGSAPQQASTPQYGSAPQHGAVPQHGTNPGQYGGGIEPQVGSSEQAPHQSFASAPANPNSGNSHSNEQTDQHQSAQQAPAQQHDNVPGIYDPRTGEVMPVADLNRLQDTDALLVVVSGPDAGAQILLDTDVVTVGRSPNADIFLDDVTVSRKHAEFVRTPSGFTLRDTGSLNGTYVGRQLIDSVELRNGADVQIGKFRMIFQQRPRQ